MGRSKHHHRHRKTSRSASTPFLLCFLAALQHAGALVLLHQGHLTTTSSSRHFSHRRTRPTEWTVREATSRSSDWSHSNIESNLNAHVSGALSSRSEVDAKPSNQPKSRRRRPRSMPESGDPTMSLRNVHVAVGATNAYSSSSPYSLNDFSGRLEESMREQSNNHFKSLETCPALVLNADFQPLSWIPLSLWCWQDAMKAVFADRVVVVATYDEEVRSAAFSMRLPSVIALKTYVNQGKKKPSFTRRNVYLRDSYSCQYCGTHLPSHMLTFDHVYPRSQGGGTSWSNVVTACHHCNSKKKDYHLSEIERLGMKLLRTPRTPNFFELQAAAKKFPPKVMHPTWRDYLTWDAVE